MTTPLPEPARRPGGLPRFRAPVALGLLACLVALLTVGCSPSTSAENSGATAGGGMAGPDVSVQVTPEALATEPAPPDLTDPQSAVRSYLDWISYAYRTGQSQTALPTMTSYQEVRVDSYVQYNLQQQRLLDQTLVSIDFGKPVAQEGRTLVPAEERWQYRYVSATRAGEVLGGPYEASFEATYTVVPNGEGGWVVDSVEAATGDAIQ